MHVPVLLLETIALLDPKQGEFFIDGTLGGGGHSKIILDKIGKTGKLLVVDLDKKATDQFKEETAAENVIIANDNFAKLPEILKKHKLRRADGLILDLGFSSDQIELSGRGFSFLRDEPLLMTYSDENEPLYQLLTRMKQEEIEAVIRDYGDERYAGRIAREIREKIRRREIIRSSKELADLIKRAVPANYEHGRIHPATRTFQAFRIYANKEVENLESVLANIGKIVTKGGRVAVISFHSLEDRIVKNYFRNYAKEQKVEILTDKPVTASIAEVSQNPRSRSAKLRAVKILKS
ncbi:MAG: 16S rRNA (cytosine(1402)-N(4))-methyltransferase RsmH [Candidatus Pacebacteria bacterium]|nr:16S rRNA (cytosine(1402)-N(4))-methyltransferase RsmH [Candidatus Paceibacterota bacterium]